MIAVHLEDGRIEVRQTPQPSRPEGFALIRLLCAGICNTDLEITRGYMAYRGIPGHEFVGVVEEAAQVKSRIVTFSGDGPSWQAALAGHVEASANNLSIVFPQVKAGKLRALAIMADKRSPYLPDVPTFKELGYEITLGVFHSVFVPKNTPDNVVKILGDALRKAMDTEPFRKFVQSSNYVVDYQDGAALKKQLEAHYNLMGTMIQKLNLKK